MKNIKSNVLDATRARALELNSKKLQAKRVQIINTQTRNLQRQRAIRQRQLREEEKQRRQYQQAAKKYIQCHKQLEEVKRLKEKEAERERKAAQKAIEQNLRLQEEKRLKEQQMNNANMRRTRRGELALEKEKILQTKNQYEEAKMTAYARKNFLETVANQERQKATSFAERKLANTKPVETQPLDRPKYIAVRGPIDYSRTCIHNPLVQELQSQIENAVEKAEAEIEKLKLSKEQERRLSMERQRSAEKRGKDALQLLQKQKEIRLFENEQREKERIRKIQLIQEGFANSELGVRPLTLVQQQIQNEKDIEAEMDRQFTKFEHARLQYPTPPTKKITTASKYLSKFSEQSPRPQQLPQHSQHDEYEPIYQPKPKETNEPTHHQAQLSNNQFINIKQELINQAEYLDSLQKKYNNERTTQLDPSAQGGHKSRRRIIIPQDEIKEEVLVDQFIREKRVKDSDLSYSQSQAGE